MKVLVIGSGGREHALAWKLAQSPKVQTVFVAPGNGGTALDSRLRNVDLSSPAELADFAQAEKIGVTVVGPEGPLAAGVVDVFRARGLRIFGPTQAAAQLESSKVFSKAFMLRQTRDSDLAMFQKIANAPEFKGPEDVPLTVLIPTFIVSELKTAFQIGFLIFIPFLIIDLVVASVLMSMGMMMLSPMLVSLPFKIMLFVLVDGWSLLMGTLAGSFA